MRIEFIHLYFTIIQLFLFCAVVFKCFKFIAEPIKSFDSDFKGDFISLFNADFKSN